MVWSDEDSDTESVDVDVDDSDRLFTFEVAKTKEQKESAVSRPGFQVFIPFTRLKSISNQSKMKSRHISCHEVSDNCSVDPSIFVPHLLHGETAQGFWTVTYIPRQTQSEIFDQGRSFSDLSLKKLL